MTQPTSGLSRRTLAKGAAWSVPAISVAAAAPLVSASPTTTTEQQCLIPTIGANACKRPGDKTDSYSLEICFVNQCSKDLTFKITNISTNNTQLFDGSTTPLSLTVPGGGQACTPLMTYSSGNSASWIYISGYFLDDPKKATVKYSINTGSLKWPAC